MAGAFDPAAFDSGAFDAARAFTLDAVIRVNRSSSFTVNSVVKKALSSSFTLDASISRRFQQSVTLNAVVKRSRTGSFAIDAVIPAAAGEGFFSINAVVRKARTSSLAIDAIVAIHSTGSATINAVVRKGRSGSFTVNAYVRPRRSFTIDAWVSVVSTVTWEGRNRHDRLDTHVGMTPASAISLTGSYPQYPGATNLFQLLQLMWEEKSAKEAGHRIRYGAASLDAVIRAHRQAQFSLDAAIRTGGQATIDAIIQAVMQGGFTLDAAVLTNALLTLDDFNRTTSPDDLGTSSSGPVWSGGPFTDIDSFANGAEWQFNQTGGSFSNFAQYSMDHGSNLDATDYTIMVRLKVGTLFTTGIATPDQYGNFEFYGGFAGSPPEVGLYYYPDQDSDLHLFVVDSNTGDPLTQTVVDVVPGDGEWYLLVWEHHPSSNTSRAKIYRESDPDPGWLVTRDPTGDVGAVLPSYFQARIDGWSDSRIDWIKVSHD
jgi:hypothetical protein